jgi:hypothetical protein
MQKTWLLLSSIALGLMFCGICILLLITYYLSMGVNNSQCIGTDITNLPIVELSTGGEILLQNDFTTTNNNILGLGSDCLATQWFLKRDVNNLHWITYRERDSVYAFKFSTCSDREAWLNCRTGDGGVDLAGGLGPSGTLWQVIQIDKEYSGIRCLGDIEGPRWLSVNGRGELRLRETLDKCPTTAWWRIIQ